MALTNNILAGPDGDINYGAYKLGWQEFTFTATLADITGLGANLTGDIVLINLPAQAVPLYGYLRHTTNVAGPSISACTAQLTVQGGNLTPNAFDVFTQAAAPTAFDFGIATSTIAKPTAINAVNPVKLHLAATGANLNVATAGQIVCVVGYRGMGTGTL